MNRLLVFLLAVLCLSHITFSQTTLPLLKNDEIKLALSEDGTRYVRLTFLNQTWVRFTEQNRGTTIFGNAAPETWDVGLRRTRIQFLGQLSDRTFFYIQFGQNNFAFTSQRKVGAFFHDVTGEYAFIKRHLSIGAGLSGWSGLARYASPSVGTVMSLDAPLFEQATNDVTDQFLRKLGVYAKGKIGKLDYRVALSQPFMIQTSTVAQRPLGAKLPNGSPIATYNANIPTWQWQAYLMYQFLDEELNTIPYTTGTYLGKKKVFNLGAGFIYQPNAMWYMNGTDTVKTAMRLLAADVYYDAPLNVEKGTALNFYAVYCNNDYGQNYIRNLGVMNLGDGVQAGQGTFTGTGNGFAMEGTGSIVYTQAGYLCKKNLLKSWGTLMPYAGMQWASYQAYKDNMLMWHVGVNWFIKGHQSKISLDYQNRPVFDANAQRELVEIQRKGMLVLQYQLFL
jgi:hypothetical protein